MSQFTQKLLNHALKTNIYFSQVREDPIIDESFINAKIKTSLLIASGGDTVAYMIGKYYDDIEKMYLLDVNPAQIALTKIKIYLLQYDTETRLKILGHKEMNISERKKTITNILNTLSIPFDVFRELNQDCSLDQSGRYEILFSYMRKYLKSCGYSKSDIIQMDKENTLHKNVDFLNKLKESIQLVFQYDILKQIFGENAVSNNAMQFSDHFYNVTYNYIQQNSLSDSPFLSQFLIGCFTDNVYYDWYNLKKLEKEKIEKLLGLDGQHGMLEFHNCEMLTFFEKQKINFNFIHLSNITDWLNNSEADRLSNLVYNSLVFEGISIIRILNSKVTFPNAEFKSQNEIQKKDRSFFYQQIYVASQQSLLKKFHEYIKLADQAIADTNFFSSSIFNDITNDCLDFEKFCESQSKFFFAVDYFARPMCALISRCENFEQRKIILENILEEHGELEYEKTHSYSFKKFLNSISVNTTQKSYAVDEFNAFLMHSAFFEHLITSFATFGIIEYIFLHVSKMIGTHLKKKNRTKNNVILHYSVHEELDIQHSTDFFSLVPLEELKNEEKKKLFIDGLQKGAAAFKNLYDRIYK